MTMWYKKNVFRNLIKELGDLWPSTNDDKEAADVKRMKLSRLGIVQFCKYVLSYKNENKYFKSS